MPPVTRRTRPCKACRDRHLKCESENNEPCSNCERSGLDCVRAHKDFRFKSGAQPKRKLKFSSDQTWLQTAQGGFSFVAETPAAPATPPAQRDVPSSVGEDGPSEETSLSQSQTHHPQIDSSIQQRISSPSTSNPAASELLFHSDTPIDQDEHDPLISSIELSTANDTSTNGKDLESKADVSPFTASSTIVSPIAGQQRVPGDPIPIGVQEACLIRHFTEALAHTFDTTDGDAHYTLTVPQRAMHSAMLLYAICTASARHLTTIWNRKTPRTVVVFNGVELPDLTADSAIHYHNVCLGLLIDFSNDPSLAPSEDALAAATLLRFYEQVDSSLTGLDSETYQSVVQAVMNAPNIETLFTLQSTERYPISNADNGLRRSACLIALRQEIWSVILYRRPFRLPIATDIDWSTLGPADDFVWSNRIIIWCADVLRFCFGPDTAVQITALNSGSAFERWDNLKSFEVNWEANPPTSFKPLFYAPADPTRGAYFPRIWHLNDAQLLGMQHFEIARMLLAVYNPRRHRVGLGSSAVNKAIEHLLRKSVLRICGLALANKSFQAGLTGGAASIAIGGEYFHDPGEQNAIIGFLTMLAQEHAWPTEATIEALHGAWNLHPSSHISPSPQGPASI